MNAIIALGVDCISVGLILDRLDREHVFAHYVKSLLVANLQEDAKNSYTIFMSDLRAKVKNGRLVLDEPTNLPEGTVLELVVDDEGDDLDDGERQALNAAISRAWESAKAGNLRPAGAIVDELREKRK